MCTVSRCVCYTKAFGGGGIHMSMRCTWVAPIRNGMTYLLLFSYSLGPNKRRNFPGPRSSEKNPIRRRQAVQSNYVSIRAVSFGFSFHT